MSSNWRTNFLRFGDPADVTLADADATLTETQSKARLIVIKGTLTATRTVYFPLRKGWDWPCVVNATTKDIIVKGRTGAGVTINAGGRAPIVCDGQNMVSPFEVSETSEPIDVTGETSITLEASQQNARVLLFYGTNTEAPLDVLFAELRSGLWVVVNDTDGPLRVNTSGSGPTIQSGSSALVSVDINSTIRGWQDTAIAGTFAGTFAARPVAGVAGRIYHCTDFRVSFYDDGADWVPYFGSGPMGTTPPLVGSFTAVAATQYGVTATLTDSADGLLIDLPQGSSHFDEDMRPWVIPTPGTPYTRTALIRLGSYAADNAFVGLGWRESGSGKMVFFGLVVGATGVYYGVRKLNGPGSFNSTYLNGNLVIERDVWLRIADTGANRVCSASFDGGESFVDLHTVGRTDFLTADQIGLFVGCRSARAARARVLSWG